MVAARSAAVMSRKTIQKASRDHDYVCIIYMMHASDLERRRRVGQCFAARAERIGLNDKAESA